LPVLEFIYEIYTLTRNKERIQRRSRRLFCASLMSSCIKAIAAAWVHTLKCTKMLDDKDSVMANAIDTLNVSIQQLKGQESILMGEMSELAHQIKTRDKASLKPLLIKSKQKRMKLTQLVRKRESFEQHLEVIYNSELDQTLISAVKTTATAMKNLGLDKKISDVDDIMSDLEESHSDVKDINNILSQKMSIHEDDFDENDLEEELNILMGIESEENNNDYLKSKLMIKSKKMEPPKVESSMEQDKVERVGRQENEEEKLDLPMPAA